MLRKCGVLDTAHAESSKQVLCCSPCKCSVCNSILLDLSLFPLSYSLPPSPLFLHSSLLPNPNSSYLLPCFSPILPLISTSSLPLLTSCLPPHKSHYFTRLMLKHKFETRVIQQMEAFKKASTHCYTVEPRLADTPEKRTPRLCGHFLKSQRLALCYLYKVPLEM